MITSKNNTNSTTRIHSTSFIHSTNTPIMTRCLLSVAIASSLLLVGCNDDNDKITYTNAPQHIASFTASEIDQELQEASAIGKAVTPDAVCGVTVEKISYQTKGSGGEATNATAALMLPTGESKDCQGDRPVLLHAHGTATEKSYDFTQVGNTDNPAGARATLMAANFAAQGYIVVAPNYAGYDTSTLDYHPYLNAKQQSEEMVTVLDTARTMMQQQKSAGNIKYTKVNDSGKLFLTGYSQGGHVAMATAQLLQDQNKVVTAIAPSSGPYALAAFGDAIVSGNVNVGATAFVPLLARSLQNVDGKIYRNPTEIFTDQYAGTKLPTTSSFEDLIRAGKLPQTALFEANTNETGFGFDTQNYLIQTSFRAAYLADAQANPDNLLADTGLLPEQNPQNELRKALKANDLRGYTPKMPTLICGGNQDPTVFYDLNTGAMAGILQQVSASNPTAKLNVTVLDVDATNDEDRVQNTVTSIGSAMSNPWMLTSAIPDIQTKFAGTVQLIGKNAYDQTINSGGTVAEAQYAAQVAIASTYHAGLVSTACINATRQFFDQEFNSI
ncbi:lipase family protein [uncultured Psychrobacter sp.]|jgi:pimeloyl-ACP methyl ester carboxylesterase|uniref:alpha/beta hydrolase family protein n=2 Tax=uncultured Psychrobacter sp. TaxID=259303 RepID=UPI000ED73A32|nr:lipase family protein [uncultured Psychrobacter sp.]HAM60688.1 alpha/beta hydrolase [Psychrobacter sp.]